MLFFMPELRQVGTSKKDVSKLAIFVLSVTFLVGMFVAAFDQGHIFSLVYGQEAFLDPYLHELFHDTRHAAGFPCH